MSKALTNRHLWTTQVLKVIQWHSSCQMHSHPHQGMFIVCLTSAMLAWCVSAFPGGWHALISYSIQGTWHAQYVGISTNCHNRTIGSAAMAM